MRYWIRGYISKNKIGVNMFGNTNKKDLDQIFEYLSIKVMYMR